METKTIVVSVIASVLVVLGVVAFTPAKVINQVSQLGAVASPDIQSPYFSVGGIRHWASKSDYSLTLATTTPCALLSPVSTSTLQFASFQVSSTSASATYVEFGKSTTAYATTTSLGILSLGSGARGTLVASSTANWSNLDGSAVFSPSTYLVLKVAGAAPTQLGGNCEAVWIEN